MKKIFNLFIVTSCLLILGCTRETPKDESLDFNLNQAMVQFFKIRGEVAEIEQLSPTLGVSKFDEVNLYLSRLSVKPDKVVTGSTRDPRFGKNLAYILCYYGSDLISFDFGTQGKWEDLLIRVSFSIKHDYGVLGRVPTEKETTAFSVLTEAYGHQYQRQRENFFDEKGQRQELDSNEYIWKTPTAIITYTLEPGKGPVSRIDFLSADYYQKNQKNSPAESNFDAASEQ